MRAPLACYSEKYPWACSPPERMKITYEVAPAKAGAHCGSVERWIPAFAGMTSRGVILGGAPCDAESRSALKMLRARFLAEFTLSTQSEIPSLRSGQALRCAQDDSEGLGMTVRKRLSQRLVGRESICRRLRPWPLQVLRPRRTIAALNRTARRSFHCEQESRPLSQLL